MLKEIPITINSPMQEKEKVSIWLPQPLGTLPERSASVIPHPEHWGNLVQLDDLGVAKNKRKGRELSATSVQLNSRSEVLVLKPRAAGLLTCRSQDKAYPPEDQSSRLVCQRTMATGYPWTLPAGPPRISGQAEWWKPACKAWKRWLFPQLFKHQHKAIRIMKNTRNIIPPKYKIKFQ